MNAHRMTGAAWSLLSVIGLSLSLSGCDYWPPALQAQIEQLRSEAQTLTVEKAQLQSQINELAKSKQDLLTQVDELNRVNREKTTVIASLQNQLDAMRAKAVKAPAKTAAKSAAKPAAKAPVKKKPAVKKR